MFVKQLLLGSALLVMFGCTSIPIDKGSSAGSIAMHEAGVVPSQIIEKPVLEEVETQISAELLYGILGGELLGQRGDFNMATGFYVAAAKRSKDPAVALRAVQIALYSKDVAAAVSVIDILLNAGKQSLEVTRLAFNVYLQAGDSKNSLQQALVLLKEGQGSQRNRLLALGEIISKAANKQTALAVIDGLITATPEDAGGYLAKSQIILRHKDVDLANQSALKAVELGSDWPVAYMQLARISVVKGELVKALSVLEQANNKLDDNRLRMAYAQLLAKLERYPDAEKVFSNIVKQDESSNEARLSLALVYLKLDKSEAAIEEFLILHKVPSYEAKAAYYLGEIYSILGDFESSIRWLSRVGDGVLYIEARVAMAASMGKQGEIQKARAVLQELRRVAPKKATHFYVLEGEMLFDADKPEDMLVLMNHAIDEKPDDLILRYARSIAAAELENIGLVETDLKMILEKEPNNVNALNALGYSIASMTFRFEEAEGYLRKALKLRAEDPAIMDSMGWLYYRTGQYESALELLEKAYRKAPQPEIAFHLGEALWMLGREEEARKLWLEAVKQDPDDKFSKEISKKLR